MPRVNFNVFTKKCRSSVWSKWRTAPLFFLTITAILGILGADFLPATPNHWLIFCFACGAGAVGFLRRTGVRAVFVAFLCAGSFGAMHSAKLEHLSRFVLLGNLENGEQIRVSKAIGQIVTEPKVIGTGAMNSGRAVIRIREFQLVGRTWKSDHSFPIFFSKLPKNLRYGDKIEVNGVFEPLEPAVAPGAFDEKQFHFRTNDAVGSFVVKTADSVRILDHEAGNPVVSAAIQTRDWLQRALTHGIEEKPIESRSVITAMVLGAREDAPDEIEDLFRLSGTMHIFAVSGLHVGIIAGAAFFILPLFGFSRRATCFVIIPLVLFYAFVTGLRPSAIRASIMVAVVALAFCVRQKPQIINSLGFAALIILGINTQEIFQVGFQLSFAVLFAIVVLAQPMSVRFHAPFATEPLMPRRLIARPRLWLEKSSRKLTDGLGVSIAAWIGSLVLIGWHFKIISLTAVIANLFMIPLAAMLINVALISSAFFPAIPLISGLLNQINAFLATVLVKLAFLFSSIPGGYVNAPSLPQPVPDEPKPSKFSLEIVSNEGGMAKLFSIPANHAPIENTIRRHWLLDSGDPLLFRSKVQPLLRSHGINRLDGILLSHGDQDHIGAAPIVIDRFWPRVLFESPLKNRARTYKNIRTLAELKKIQSLQMVRGASLDFSADRSLRWDILFPPKDYPDQPRADDHSLVILFHCDDWRILMTFDSGFTTEKWLLENKISVKSDVWIKGWHSTAPSGLTEFLDQVQPKVIIATNSDVPAYEKITEARKAEFRARDIQWLDLSKEGCVTLSGSMERLLIESFVNPGHSIELAK